MAHKTRQPYIISVTGTKGKTSIVRLLDHVFSSQNFQVLRVDTDGHYLNQRQLSTHEDSMELHGFNPTTAPGRYLYELRDITNGIALLEESLSCFTAGTGYRRHNIGIFTNVYDDHIGRRVRNRRQLAQEKASFIFKRITPGGTAIFNADDPLVCKNLTFLSQKYPVFKLPVGISFQYFDIKNHLKSGGCAITIQDSKVGILSAKKFAPVLDLTKNSFSFGGHYPPSAQNLMFAYAALYARNNFAKVPKTETRTLNEFMPAKDGGRLIVLKDKKRNISILLDYAHEKHSFAAIGKLAEELSSTGRVIGVLRIHPDRTDKAIAATAKYIAQSFSTIIVYDKVDGKKVKKYFDPIRQIERLPGEVSEIFTAQLVKYRSTDKKTLQIIDEKAALEQALALADPGDVIVYIANTNPQQSFNLVSASIS